jgi:hypothetical protein
VELLVEALHHQLEGSSFYYRWGHWDFLLTYPSGPLFDSAFNRNEHQNYLLGDRCLGLTTLIPSCSDCLEILGAQPPGALSTCPDVDVFRSHVVLTLSLFFGALTCCGYVQDVSPTHRWYFHCQTWDNRSINRGNGM